jgi:protein-S-isoprenylcysteine O-methyltransferase Ste14
MSEIYEQQADTSPGNRTFRIHPPLLAAGLFLIGFLLHLASEHGEPAFPFHQFLGLLLVGLGSAIMSYAAALFAAGNTTRNPYGEPVTLVGAPPYTFTRNPMYVGLTTVLFGFTTFFGSVIMLLAPIVFAVVIDRMVIPAEERTMERIHGERYCDYKSRVPRWLPLPSFLQQLASRW